MAKCITRDDHEIRKFTDDSKVRVTTDGESLPVTIDPITTPTIQNISAPVTAGTEFTYNITATNKRVRFRSRQRGTVKIAYSVGGTSTAYFTLTPGNSHEITGLGLSSDLTLYLASSKANDIIEFILWE